MSKRTYEPSKALLRYLGLDGVEPERAIKAARQWLTQKKYRFGLNPPNDFENLLEIQLGKCGICNAACTCILGKKGYKGGFHIDHDEQTKYIRGLLCDRCNRGLGYFRHNPIHLQAAIRYLSEPPAAEMKPMPRVVLEQRNSKLYDARGVRRVRRVRNASVSLVEPHSI